MTRPMRILRAAVFGATVWAVATAVAQPTVNGYSVLAIVFTALTAAFLIGPSYDE